jgi:hypothetical protein
MKETAPENETLSAEAKKRRLFERQKTLLDTFLSNGAITKAQHEKSLGDLIVKMGITAE